MALTRAASSGPFLQDRVKGRGRRGDSGSGRRTGTNVVPQRRHQQRPTRPGGGRGADADRVIGALPAGQRGEGGGGEVTQAAGTERERQGAAEVAPEATLHVEVAGVALTRAACLGPSL